MLKISADVPVSYRMYYKRNVKVEHEMFCLRYSISFLRCIVRHVRVVIATFDF
jgi:hypothetical protein